MCWRELPGVDDAATSRWCSIRTSRRLGRVSVAVARVRVLVWSFRYRVFALFFVFGVWEFSFRIFGPGFWISGIWFRSWSLVFGL